MSNYKYINKIMITDNLYNLDYLNTLHTGEGISMDFWSKSFYNNYNNKYKQYNLLRDKVIRETNDSSDKTILIQNKNTKGLKYISNLYINLKKNPKWVDNIVSIEMLSLNVPSEVLSDFDALTNYTIKKIENYLYQA